MPKAIDVRWLDEPEEVVQSRVAAAARDTSPSGWHGVASPLMVARSRGGNGSG